MNCQCPKTDQSKSLALGMPAEDQVNSGAWHLSHVEAEAYTTLQQSHHQDLQL